MGGVALDALFVRAAAVFVDGDQMFGHGVFDADLGGADKFCVPEVTEGVAHGGGHVQDRLHGGVLGFFAKHPVYGGLGNIGGICQLLIGHADGHLAFDDAVNNVCGGHGSHGLSLLFCGIKYDYLRCIIFDTGVIKLDYCVSRYFPLCLRQRSEGGDPMKNPIIVHIEAMLNAVDTDSLRAIYMVVKRVYDLQKGSDCRLS